MIYLARVRIIQIYYFMRKIGLVLKMGLVPFSLLSSHPLFSNLETILVYFVISIKLRAADFCTVSLSYSSKLFLMNLNIFLFQLFMNISVMNFIHTHDRHPHQKQIKEGKKIMDQKMQNINSKGTQPFCGNDHLTISMPYFYGRFLPFLNHNQTIFNSGFQVYSPSEQVNSRNQLSFQIPKQPNDEQNLNPSRKQKDLPCAFEHKEPFEDGCFVKQQEAFDKHPFQSFQKQKFHKQLFYQHQSNQKNSQSDSNQFQIAKCKKKSIKKANKNSRKIYTYKRINRFWTKRKWRKNDAITLSAFLYFHQKGIQEGKVTLKRLFEYSKGTDRQNAQHRYRNFRIRNKSLTFQQKIEKIKANYGITQIEFETQLQKIKQFEESQKSPLEISLNKQSRLKQLRQFSKFEEYNPALIDISFGKFEDQINIKKAELQIIARDYSSKNQQMSDTFTEQKKTQVVHALLIIKCELSQKNEQNMAKNDTASESISLNDIKRCFLETALKEKHIFELISRNLNLDNSSSSRNQKQSSKNQDQDNELEKAVLQESKPCNGSIFVWRRQEKIKLIGFIRYFEQVLDDPQEDKFPIHTIMRLISGYIETKSEDQCVNTYEHFKKGTKSIREFSKVYMKANQIYEKDLIHQPVSVLKYFEKFKNRHYVTAERKSFRMKDQDSKGMLKRIQDELKRASLKFVNN